MTNTCNKSLLRLGSWTNILSIMSLLTLSVTVHAAAPSIKQAIAECAQQANSLQRLVCYDRVSAQLNVYTDAAPALAPQATIQSTPTVTPTPTAKTIAKSIPVAVPSSPTEQGKDATDSFGKTVATEDSMVAKIASVKTGRNNLMTITLDNGQVWQQTKSEDRARLSAQQVVTFEKGFFGAFYLSAEGSNRRVAVKRLK